MLSRVTQCVSEAVESYPTCYSATPLLPQPRAGTTQMRNVIEEESLSFYKRRVIKTA